MLELTFAAPMWLWPGGGWRFVSLPEDATEVLQESGPRRGFGSVRVEVTVGATTWKTSVFPDKSRGVYVLPMKKPVRDAEGLVDDAVVALRLRLLD